LYKDSNSNVIYVIERFNKEDYGWGDNSTQSYVFTNSKIYTVIGADELLRLYDNVPRTAEAQTIMANRLFYGNYVDGYNITNATGSNISVNYNTKLINQVINFIELDNATLTTGIDYTLSGVNTSITNSLATIDLTAIKTLLKAESTFALSLNLTSSEVTSPNDSLNPCYPLSFSNGDVTLNLSFVLPVDYNSIYDMISSDAFANRLGTVLNTNFNTIATCADGTSITDQFNCALTVPSNCPGWTKYNSSLTDATAQQGFKLVTLPGDDTFTLQPIAMNFRETNAPVTDIFEFFRFESVTAAFSTSSDTASLHSNRDFETGIVYMDDYARASTVLVSEYNTIFIPAENSTSKNQIQCTISSLPPSWASRYKMVVKPSKTGYETIYSNFIYIRPSNNNVYFKLEGDNQNKAEKGQKLIVKRDVNGALLKLSTCEVLDIVAEGENFLADLNELGTDSHQVPGLYMIIKSQNFNVTILESENSVIALGEKKYKSDNENWRRPFVGYPIFTTTTDPGPPAVDTYAIYTIPEGSIIDIRIFFGRSEGGSGCQAFAYEWDRQFIASQDYTNMYDWFVGDNIDISTGNWSSTDETNAPYFDSVIYDAATSDIPVGSATSAAYDMPIAIFRPRLQFWQPGYTGTIDATLPMYMCFKNGIPGCKTFLGKNGYSKIEMEITVTRANNLFVFETEPADANADIFYDASQDYSITGGYHQAGTADGDQSQTASADAIVLLPFMDCYAFGNGVESYKIEDKLAAKSLVMGQRTLAVSNQDYKEADRFAGLTYSGRFSSNSGVNNLNEFNLGLANFKDLEQNYGPVMKLHSRETDILILQEDKISYILTNKNLLSDATGGGAIASIPQILGTQIARIEDYGISFNPESFIQWGSNVFFTDTKRGAVIKLTGASIKSDEISVISDTGMRSWFRDEFSTALTTQKLGAYDPYMDEYVLSTNDVEVPVPSIPIPCGQSIHISSTSTAKTFTFDFGQVIDTTTTVTFTVTGSVTITGTWNGVAGTPVTIVNTTGNYTFSKSLNTPTTADITVTPAASTSASYTLEANCPTETAITVIQVVLNSGSDVDNLIHVEYGWNNTTTISPTASTQAVFGSSSTVASLFDSQTGIRSIGVFPYDGVDFFMQSNKIGTDDYDVGNTSYKFSFLSSNTLYANNVADINTLTGSASDILPGLITSPAPDVYRGSVTPSTTPAFSLPIGNQYLYLVYDFRTQSGQPLCYSTDVTEACCDCTYTCTAYDSSTVHPSIGVACDQPLTQSYYFLNSVTPTTYPVVGSIVYSSTICDTTTTLTAGWYKYTSGYIRVNSDGIVIQIGTC
jgi:hypothetical protein